MYRLNEKMKRFTKYDPVVEHNLIHMDANESFVGLSKQLEHAILARIEKIDLNRYPDPTAGPLCEAFAKHYGIQPCCVATGNGSDELIGLIMGAFLEKGEAFATIEPDFYMYGFYGRLYECAQVKLSKHADYTVDIDAVIEACNQSNIRLLIFSNPCNPTGIGLEREAVRKLITSVSALVVLDEAYMDFWDQSLIDEVNQYDNLILLRTCSKALGMAGVRVGFAVARKELIELVKAMKSPYNVNSVSQSIAEAVLSAGDEITNALQMINASKKMLKQGLEALRQKYGSFQIIESVTNFLSVIMEQPEDFHTYLHQKGIAVRHTAGLIRISCGTDEENLAFLKAAGMYFDEREI